MTTTKTLSCMPEDLAAHGERPAIIALGRESTETIAYEALAEKVALLARGLVAEDIERGDKVALMAPATPAWIIACLALLRSGAIPVPIDTQIDAEELARILDDAAIETVFADERGEARLDDVDFDGSVLRLDTGDDHRASWRRLSREGEMERRAPKSDETAVLFYTSGTTGPPKGVPLRQRHLRFQARAIESTGILAENDRLLLPLPLHHVYPLVIGVLVPLSLGVPIVLPHALTGPEFLRALRETDATIIVGVPRLYAALLEALESRLGDLPAIARIGLRGAIAGAVRLRAATGFNAGAFLLRPLRRRVGARLRLLASGGSPLDPSVGERLRGLGWDVAIGYGLTETAPLLTLNPPGSRRMDSVGRALEGVELRIDPQAEVAGDADADDDGREGEILARGPGVFDGYFELDEETEKAFTDDGWFRTGDLGRIDGDGHLYVAGRKSTMIVTASGENIRTEALEEAYAEHRLIEEIGILKSGDRLCAVIFPDSSELRKESASVDSVIGEAVRERSRTMASYERIDEFRIAKQPLERTRLGKIRRHKLEARFEALATGDAEESAQPVAVAEMEKPDRELLRDDEARAVWRLLCERYAERPLAPDTDVRLELGIDSMGWLDLSMEIAAATGVELDEADIAGIDRVRDLLEIVAEDTGGGDDYTAPLEDPESALSADQRRWLEKPAGVRRWLARILYALNRGFMRAVFGVRAHGIDELAQRPPAPLIIAPNHTSFLDPFALASALPNQVLENVHWGGWTGYALRNPLFRGVSRLAGVVPVEPERAMISSLAFGAAVLGRNRSLVWFPEGERARDGELRELRPGIGALLEAVPDARVMPVFIEGAYEAWPRGRRLPRPHRIRVRFGEPATPAALAEGGRGESKRERIVDGLRGALLELQEKGSS